MTRRIEIGCVVGLLVSFCPSPARSAESCATVADAVRQLGEGDGIRAVESLHRCGKAAVPLLVRELRIVDPEIPNRTWLHAVWCERALRSITGKYFRFRTQLALGGLSEFRGKDDDLGYAMEWMSRGKIFVAPQDVQRKVIAAWKSWLKANHGQFEVAKFDPGGEWQR